MKAVLDACKHLRVPLENLHDFGVRLLYDPDGPRQELGPLSKASSTVWCPKEDDAVSRIKDGFEVTFRPLSRPSQRLRQRLAQFIIGRGLPYIFTD